MSDFFSRVYVSKEILNHSVPSLPFNKQVFKIYVCESVIIFILCLFLNSNTRKGVDK